MKKRRNNTPRQIYLPSVSIMDPDGFILAMTCHVVKWNHKQVTDLGMNHIWGDAMNIRLKVQDEAMLLGHVYEVKWNELETLKDKIKATMRKIDAYGDMLSIIDRHKQIGVSQHLMADGFIYFIGVEVARDSFIPEDLEVFMLPGGLVLRSRHITLEAISETYESLRDWIEESEYEPFKEPGIPYYDPLPIKYEIYDKKSGNMEIRIPVVRKERFD